MANTDAREGNAHTVSNMLTAALRRQAVRLHDQQSSGLTVCLACVIGTAPMTFCSLELFSCCEEYAVFSF